MSGKQLVPLANKIFRKYDTLEKIKSADFSGNFEAARLFFYCRGTAVDAVINVLLPYFYELSK